VITERIQRVLKKFKKERTWHKHEWLF
jgi:hypothetical protein